MSIKAGGLTLEVFCFMGMYIVQHTLAFLQHWRIVFFKAVNKFFQILHGKQKKKTKRLTSSSQLWALFRVKVQTVHQKVWRKKSQNRNPTGPLSNLKVFKNLLIHWFNYQQLHQSSNGLPNGLTEEINLRLLDIWK